MMFSSPNCGTWANNSSVAENPHFPGRSKRFGWSRGLTVLPSRILPQIAARIHLVRRRSRLERAQRRAGRREGFPPAPQSVRALPRTLGPCVSHTDATDRVNSAVTSRCRCRLARRRATSSLRRLFDDLDFFIREAVEFVHELVDLAVGRVDLTLDGRLVRWRLGLRERFGGNGPIVPAIQLSCVTSQCASCLRCDADLQIRRTALE